MSRPCAHCDQPIPRGVEGSFCCIGCRTVHGLLRRAGLDRYYDLRRGAGVALVDLPEREPASRKWLEVVEARRRESPEDAPLHLDVQGIHCAACVWLLEELFDRHEGVGSIEVNPALGHVALRLAPDFPLASWVAEVESLGYRLGPATELERPASDGLLIRAVICLALAGNAMFFQAALYLGLEEGRLHSWVERLGYFAALLAVLIGAPVFLKSAWLGLRRGLLHLDLPIALGIVLAFAGSTWSFFWGESAASYFDTVAAFVGLMLFGRWLQTRVLEQNRRMLRRDRGAEGLLVRAVRDSRVELIPCTELKEGAELLIAPGDLIPVASELLNTRGSCSLDWVDGESAPRAFVAGATLPSGAFNVGSAALRVRAREDFSRSEVASLLQVRRGESASDSETPWWQRIGGPYVGLVLGAAALGFSFWFVGTGDLARSLEVAIATLVVTCPCAFGIATPLAYELTSGRLRRAGIYIRRRSFFDRALDVERIVFDKTGTLTSGTLKLAEADALRALSDESLGALYDLCSGSTHPKSAAIHRALDRAGLGRLSAREVHEVAGRGVVLHAGERTYRLGSRGWAAPTALAPEGSDVVLARDGVPLHFMRFEESLRPEAEEEIRALGDAGYDLWILSGDAREKAERLATELGLPPERGLGEYTPEEKAAWLLEHDAPRTMMVGDGLNDSLAVQTAGCSATPAVDRPFMAARCDLFFVTPGLGPVAQSLRAARRLQRTIRGNLIFAVFYNMFAIALCWAGLMQPWVAAILMPSSSLLTIAFTTLSLSKRSRD